MAHHRRALAAAVAVNTAIVAVELSAGTAANSVALLMDGVHNLSDEAALVLLYLAFLLPHGVSRNLVRSANVFNSLGLLVASAILLWQSVERLLHPAPVAAGVPIVVGLAAAAANLAVARLLRPASGSSAAVRLAYLHNLGDAATSLAPVVAGALVAISGMFVFDALAACGVAVWIVASTLREVATSREELLWPGKMDCGHDDVPGAREPAPR